MKKRILVIDDESEFTAVLKATLEADGYYDVYEENDATCAVMTAHEVDPDLIVLDVMMPELDGSDVAARLREDRWFSDVPIIFLTALALGHEAPFSGAAAKGQTYLPKSTPIDRLIDCIELKIEQSAAAMAPA
jgi:CheY-like chemotaxis protein